MGLKAEIYRSEPDLVAGLMAGNPKILEEVFDKYSPLALLFLKDLRLSEEKREEILLICFLNISNNIQEFDLTKMRLFPWILNIIRQTINNLCSREVEKFKIQDQQNYVHQKSDLSDPSFLPFLIRNGKNLEELSVLKGITKQEMIKMIKNNINQLKK